MESLPTPASPWMAGANNAPNVPQFQPQDTSNPPEMEQSPAATGLSGGIGAPAAPEAPHVTVAQHILSALGGSSGEPMAWAKSILAGGLAGAANVGKQPEGAGWLHGAAQGAQGVQELQRQKMLDQQNTQQKQQEMQLKQKQDARADQELQIHMEDAKTQRAMWTAQTAASIQTQQQNAARFGTLQQEDQLKVKQLQDQIQTSEQDQLAVLSAAGVHIEDLEHITDSSQLTSSHAKQAGAGDIFPVQNGEAHKAGEDGAGAYLVPGNVWEQPITKPVTITTGYDIDPKTGKATPRTTTAQEGTKVGTLLSIAKGAQMDLANKQKVIMDQADIQAKRAALEHEQASTEHEKAETENVRFQMGNGNGGLPPKIKNEVDKASTQGKDSYSNFAAENNGFRQTLEAAENGDQVASAFAKTMGIQGVNKLADLSRISPAEYDAMGKDLGSWGRQFSTFLTKAGTGKMPADTRKELLSMADRLSNAKYGTYLANMSLVTQAFDPSKVQVLSKDGNSTTSLADAKKQMTPHAVPLHGVPIMRDGQQVGYILDGKRTDF